MFAGISFTKLPLKENILNILFKYFNVLTVLTVGHSLQNKDEKCISCESNWAVNSDEKICY